MFIYIIIAIILIIIFFLLSRQQEHFIPFQKEKKKRDQLRKLIKEKQRKQKKTPKPNHRKKIYDTYRIKIKEIVSSKNSNETKSNQLNDLKKSFKLRIHQNKY